MAPRYLLESVFVIFVIFLTFITLYLDSHNKNILSTIGLFGVAAIRLMPISATFVSTLINIRFNRDSISRLYADIKHSSKSIIKKHRPISLSDESFKSLKLKDVKYSYPRTKVPALRNLSFEINNGESIALIGPSGSGKTTLVDVLLGLLEPQSGTLEYNEKPLFENLETWHYISHIFLSSCFSPIIHLSATLHWVWRLKILKRNAYTRLCVRHGSASCLKSCQRVLETLLGERSTTFRRTTAACRSCPGFLSSSKCACNGRSDKRSG